MQSWWVTPLQPGQASSLPETKWQGQMRRTRTLQSITHPLAMSTVPSPTASRGLLCQQHPRRWSREAEVLSRTDVRCWCCNHRARKGAQHRETWQGHVYVGQKPKENEAYCKRNGEDINGWLISGERSIKEGVNRHRENPAWLAAAMILITPCQEVKPGLHDTIFPVQLCKEGGLIGCQFPSVGGTHTVMSLLLTEVAHRQYKAAVNAKISKIILHLTFSWVISSER